MRGLAVALIALLVLQTLGAPISAGFYFVVGHWALLFPIIMTALGSLSHFIYCRREGIHPLYATPRRKYYELRGWKWQE